MKHKRRKKQNKGCLFGLIDLIIGLLKKNKKEPIPQYRRKFLLTKNELNFYKELKKVADKLNLSVLAKIRMADLVEAIDNNYKGFAKVKAKHIDFALCNPENMYIVLLIELDDYSHNRQNRIERDRFIEAVYEQTGYNLLRVKGISNLEKTIRTALHIEIAQ